MKSLVPEVVLHDQVRKTAAEPGRPSVEVRERVVVQFRYVDAAWEDADGTLCLRNGRNHPDNASRGVVYGYAGAHAAQIKAALPPDAVGKTPPPKLYAEDSAS